MSSRTLYRVPFDFDWPLGIIWKGYRNPYKPTNCEICDGTGYNHDTMLILKAWYNHSHISSPYAEEGWGRNITQEECDYLVSNGLLVQFTHGNVPGKGWVKVKDWVSKDAINKSFYVRDGIYQLLCAEFRAKKAGVYGKCPICGGYGHYWCNDKYQELYHNWERIEPPEGGGFQLWETGSEGSPISPILPTLDELAQWCESNATTFGKYKASKNDWIKMLSEDNVHHKEGNIIFL